MDPRVHRWNLCNGSSQSRRGGCHGPYERFYGNAGVFLKKTQGVQATTTLMIEMTKNTTANPIVTWNKVFSTPRRV